MKINVDWSAIKKGFDGFEDLAFKYVKDKFPNSTWIPTKKTRDGNKDAVAIIFGYQNTQSKSSQWWMEAKYSTEKKIISRYRLDATIVSAILEGNIKKVIFVTNILIKAKTIIDIRNALSSAIQCDDVHFCTRYSLEKWLAENIKIYRTYFYVPANIKLNNPPLFITQDIEYFSETGNRFTFKEPVRELYKNKRYNGVFEVFSPSDCVLTLREHEDIKGIEILSDKQIKLYTGETQVLFLFNIDNDYGSKSNSELPSPAFYLGDLEVVSSRHIIPQDNYRVQLQLPSQLSIIAELEEQIYLFKKRNECVYNAIEGISGVGKSFVLNKILNSPSLLNENLYFIEFSISPKYNQKALVNLILFILFPYIPPETIDTDYLLKLNNIYISDILLNMVKCINNFDDLSKLIAQFTDFESIFYMQTSLNRRFIILDDLQKLEESSARFLGLLLNIIYKKKIPIYLILSGQSDFFQSSTYELILSQCIVKKYVQNLYLKDVLYTIEKRNSHFDVSGELVYSLNFSVVELLIFIKYILENNDLLNSLHDFIFICKAFQRSTIKQEYILKKFKDFFEKHISCKPLCDKIYWSSEPIYIDLNDKEIHLASLLLTNELIKYNNDNCLVPYHDIYTEFYRVHFRLSSTAYLDYEKNSPEYFRTCLEGSNVQSDLNESIQAVLNLCGQEKYHSVMYILQDIFENDIHHNLNGRIEKTKYYQLYHAYCMAAGQQSTVRSRIELFDVLYNEIRYSDESELIEIAISCLWELIIYYYEDLDYKKVTLIIQETIKAITKLYDLEFNHPKVQEHIKYHDIMMINTLMDANKSSNTLYTIAVRRGKSMLNYGFILRYDSFMVRYALTLCVKNMEHCLSILKDSQKKLKQNYEKDSKYYLWACFHYYYYCMIYYKKSEYLEKVKKYHNKMKLNHFGNYRQRNNCIAAYFFMKEQLSSGNQYLLNETIFTKELSARQKAFHYETVAVYEIKTKKLDNANKLLDSASKILSTLPTYSQIPLHNQRVLESKGTHQVKMEFWFGGSMDQYTYYLDPRCAW